MDSSSRQDRIKLLDSVANPSDLKNIAISDLPRLAKEIRSYIIDVITQNGGHLASSLGAVELIIALHYVLNCPQDKIIFDVGHQAYAHKILTGRKEAFRTIRREGGLSGFPKRTESAYDSFDAGHASTSVSAALGFCLARDLKKEKHVVAAVIGDGAITGGMALEAMNHAGSMKSKMLVVLNDNSMSIGPNVGGLSEYLSLLFTRPEHINLREKIKGVLREYMPSRGQQIIFGVQKVEEAIKSVFTGPSTFFEAIGFKYLGPFDGHDMEVLIEAVRQASSLERPVLMHVLTTKGKGYPPAENDPCSYHGVSGRPCTPVQPPQNSERQAEPIQEKSFSEMLGLWMMEKAGKETRLCAITAAMSQGVGFDNFFANFPQRAFDVGIAEQHAVTMAAALAAEGLKPVVAIYSTFLQRSFDQLYHDVALMNLPVIVAVDRAGPVGEDGPTHHGALDLSYLRLLPNFTVMAPADGEELQGMLDLAMKLDSPCAIRYPRGKAPALPESMRPAIDPGRAVVLQEGCDLSILAIGVTVHPALKAAGKLKELGHNASVVNMRFLKPLDADTVWQQASQSRRLLIVEENICKGGLGGAVSELLACRQPIEGLKFSFLGMEDMLLEQAAQKVQRSWLGLDEDGIVKAALKLLG